jgi:hypothetical protein
MIQRIDTLSLQKPRKGTGHTSFFADLKMQEVEKHRNQFKR